METIFLGTYNASSISDSGLTKSFTAENPILARGMACGMFAELTEPFDVADLTMQVGAGPGDNSFGGCSDMTYQNSPVDMLVQPISMSEDFYPSVTFTKGDGALSDATTGSVNVYMLFSVLPAIS